MGGIIEDVAKLKGAELERAREARLEKLVENLNEALGVLARSNASIEVRAQDLTREVARLHEKVDALRGRVKALSPNVPYAPRVGDEVAWRLEGGEVVAGTVDRVLGDHLGANYVGWYRVQSFTGIYYSVNSGETSIRRLRRDRPQPGDEIVWEYACTCYWGVVDRIEADNAVTSQMSVWVGLPTLRVVE